jgi:hypothetical protein
MFHMLKPTIEIMVSDKTHAMNTTHHVFRVVNGYTFCSFVEHLKELWIFLELCAELKY